MQNMTDMHTKRASSGAANGGRGEGRAPTEAPSQNFYRLWNLSSYQESEEFNRGWNTTHKYRWRWGVTACPPGPAGELTALPRPKTP